MPEHDDEELRARFNERLAGIEDHIPDPPDRHSRVVRRSTSLAGQPPVRPRSWVASSALLIALVLMAVIAIQLVPSSDPTPSSPVAGHSPESSPTAQTRSPGLTSPTPTAPSSPRSSPSPAGPTPLVPGLVGWVGPERIATEHFDFARLVLDTDGYAHVAAAARNGLFYLTNQSGVWTSERVSSTVGESYDGEPSIVIEGDASPAIAFTRFGRLRCTVVCEPTGSEGIFFVRRQVGGWPEPALIVGRQRQEPALKSADGRLHLAFSRGDFNSRSIGYATETDEEWTTDEVANGRSPSVQIGSDGLARISFVADGKLYYAAQDGGGLFEMELVPGDWNATSPLLVLDGVDDPEIVFYNDIEQQDPSCGALYLRRTQAGTWSGGSRLFADDEFCHLIAEDIDRDTDGALHVISLYDESGPGVSYATNAGGSFRAVRIREPGRTTDDGPRSASALSVDGAGRPHVLFTVSEAGAYEIDEGEVPPDVDGLWYAVGPSM